MNSDQVMSLVRNVLLGGGALLVEHGINVTTDQWTAIVGGLMAFGAFVWSQVFHAKNGA